MPEQPIGTSIRGTTEAPSTADIAGKSIALNMAKRTYFRFKDREDFELTVAQPSAKLPSDLTVEQATTVVKLINHGHLVRGTSPKLVTRKREDRIRPYLIFLSQSRSFQQIQKRVQEICHQGGNVQNSGYNAREVLDMMIEQELETHARSDVLNMLNAALEATPGNNRPMDEPGTHAVPSRVAGGRGTLGAHDQPEQPSQGGGSRSAREAIARKPKARDIASL